jgi:hypothetical protein
MSRMSLVLSAAVLLCASSQIAFADETGLVGAAIAGAVVGGPVGAVVGGVVGNSVTNHRRLRILIDRRRPVRGRPSGPIARSTRPPLHGWRAQRRWRPFIWSS